MSVVPASATLADSTGRLQADEVRAYLGSVADTLTNLRAVDQRPRARRTMGHLGRIVVVVALLDLLACGALAATYTGLLGRTDRGTAQGSGSAVPAATVLKQTGSSPSSADYTVAAPAYRITVAARYQCWVQVTAGQSTSFASVMPAGASRTFTVTGRSSVELGSGGGSVTVQAGGHSQRVAPPSAPYTLTFSGT